MSLRVIGAGLGRTGTMSLKLALERLLGGPCYHMLEVAKQRGHVVAWRGASLGEATDWQTLMDGYVAAVDWPVAAFWRELAAEYPAASIVLSVRDPESWWASANSTIFPAGEKASGDWRSMLDALFANRFVADLRDKDACIAAYRKHVADVRREAPAERLIEWRAADGWAPLCAALKLAVPDQPFPHENTAQQFQSKIAAMVK